MGSLEDPSASQRDSSLTPPSEGPPPSEVSPPSLEDPSASQRDSSPTPPSEGPTLSGGSSPSPGDPPPPSEVSPLHKGDSSPVLNPLLLLGGISPCLAQRRGREI